VDGVEEGPISWVQWPKKQNRTDLGGLINVRGWEGIGHLEWVRTKTGRKGKSYEGWLMDRISRNIHG
jgi:hypothetical protein